MSLINEMLKDLEHRQRQKVSTGKDNVMSAVHVPYEQKVQFTLRTVGALAMASILLAGVLWGYWFFTSGPKPPETPEGVQSKADIPAAQETLMTDTAPLAAQERSLTAAFPASHLSVETSPGGETSVSAVPAKQVATELLNLHIGEHSDNLRLIAEFDQAPSYRVSRGLDDKCLHIDLKNARLSSSLPPLPRPGSFFEGLDVVTIHDRLQMVLRLKTLYDYRDFVLKPDQNYGCRLVLDVFRDVPGESVEEKETKTLAESPQVIGSFSGQLSRQQESAAGTSSEFGSGVEGQVTKIPNMSTAQHQAELAYQRATTALLHGRSQEAEANLLQALAYDQGHLQARDTLAACMLRAGRISEAAAILAEGLRVAPGYASFKRNYARILVDQGALPEAVETLLQGPLPEVDADPEYHVLLAAVYQRLGEYSLAAQVYREVLAQWPHAGVWWMGLGIALESDGQQRDAAHAYQKALENDDLRPDLIGYVHERLSALKREHSVELRLPQ